ncbi:MAG: molybdopterin-dependent oxidoreductase, partial [Alphaproteobacteria bacterium]
WELTKTESVDVMDALGSNIRVDARGDAVLRVLPRVNEGVNEEWISDKTRYAEDGLSRQRLDRPYIRENGKLRAASWGEALDATAKALSGDAKKIGAIAGDLACAESMKATLDLFRALGSPNTDCRADGAAVGGARQSYLFNSTIAGIESADAILLIGTNPRLEAPVLNARLRRRWMAGALQVGVIGEAADLTYDYDHLGDGPAALASLGRSKAGFAKVLREAKSPAIIIGAGALARADGAAVLAAAAGVAKTFGLTWNVLHAAASRVGGLDLGFSPGEGGKTAAQLAAKGGADVLVLLGADEIDLKNSDAFVVYVGTHGDAGAHRADVILPGAAYTEKS